MSDAKRKILVTGANGFVGRAVMSELQAGGEYEVYGLTGRSVKASDNGQTSNQMLFQADITDDKTLSAREEFKNTDTLIHCAGLAHQFGPVKKADFWNVNVQGTENICRLAQKIGVRHFILVSSVAVYGDYSNASIEETFVCRPMGAYAESKLESENRATELCRSAGLQLTIVRPATVIGEGDRGNTARLITTLDRGRFLWIGTGVNKKSLIYKKDVARGIKKIVGAGGETALEIYNLTAEPVSMREVVETISGALQKKTPRLKIPESLLRGFFGVNKTFFSTGRLKNFEKTFEKWLSDDIFSGRKFNEKFKFRPETGVLEALRRQVVYYRQQKRVKSLD